MAVTLHVKCQSEAIKALRKTAAQHVLNCLGNCLPMSRLLCFLDDEDPIVLRGEFGPANRGVYGPIHDNTPMGVWPDYVTSLIFVDDGTKNSPAKRKAKPRARSILFPHAIDDLVYLYGSTCANEIGLTMSLAHELQHTIQHANSRKLWAVNGLVPQLSKEIIEALKLTWADIPVEREARMVSKLVALDLFGDRRVEEFIDTKIEERVTEADAADWQFVRTLTPTSTVDLETETKQLFARLRGYESELQAVLQEKKDAKNPDFLDIELSAYL